ncbi:MAG: hypothetical protein DLM59_14585 [Pseudonocardiales bacterium]|nr:MAG: hypothetical protein DLM59_14585 [Pseudonocardiales bacterium]
MTVANEPARSNAELEKLLALAGWTPEHLGDRLNRLAATLGLGDHLHRKSVRRWVHPLPSWPAPRVPRQPWPSLVCHLLHERTGRPVTPDTLGWAAAGPPSYLPADAGLNTPWNPDGTLAALAAVVDADAMERRQFLALTGVTLTAVAHQWLFDPARVAASLTGKRVDDALVDDLERVVEARRRMDDAIGGGALLPAVREDLRLVVAMLDKAAYTERVGKRLHAAAAEFGRLAGFVAYDSNLPAVAQRYFLAGLRAAHVSGDRAIGANILGFMSIQSAHSTAPRDAVTLVESALQAESHLTPAVAASLHGRLAVGAARVGDSATSRRAQDQAFELLARSSPEDEPPWIYWLGGAHVEEFAGKSLLALGKPVDAEAHIRRAVALLDPGFSRDRAGLLCHLATARVRAGAVDQACATAGEAAALLRRLDSPREKRRLIEFRAAAAPYAGSAAVKEFDARHRDLIGTSVA